MQVLFCFADSSVPHYPRPNLVPRGGGGGWGVGWGFGSSVGGDGGNGSGVSRALVKDRLIMSKIFKGVFQVIFVTNGLTWWDFSGSRRSICNLRNFIKSNLSGQFLTLSCESL